MTFSIVVVLSIAAVFITEMVVDALVRAMEMDHEHKLELLKKEQSNDES